MRTTPTSDPDFTTRDVFVPLPLFTTMATNAIPSSPSSLSISCTSLNQPGDYNKVLQTVAVLVVFVVSSSGALLPVLSTRFPLLRIPQKVLFVFKHFGTGVLIATSFW